MNRKPRIPSYRKHSSGQARVTLNGTDHLLGTYGSAESKEEYRRLIAEWLANKDKPQPPPAEAPRPLSIAELILAYWKHAKDYYGLTPVRGDYHCLKHALRVVRSLYGSVPAIDFGPKSLKACRAEMVGKDWSRTYINGQIGRIKRMFRWAVEEELYPGAGAIYESLRSLSGLRRGKTEARETERVKPIKDEHIEATLPFLVPHVRAMVELQLVAGCRPAEVCMFRPIDLDMSNPACWVFRPPHHKTEHHGHDRLVFLGPKAQEILKPFLGTKVDAYCFSPQESERRRSQERRRKRKSPLTPSQRARKPKAHRRRSPRDRYDVNAYRRAINRACVKADKAAHEADPSIPAEQVIIPTWSPNRLRHNRATELRRYGLDVTKTVLGHSKVETTQVYAERDVKAAMELVSKIG